MSAVVTEARRWLGTPYLHQASVRGVGCDCLGLVRGVWRAVRGDEPVKAPTYSADWDEPQKREVLWTAARQYLRPVSGAWAPGQVILFRMRDGAVAKHLGIVGTCDPTPTFIHAYAAHGVVESPLSAPWRRRVVARFALEEG